MNILIWNSPFIAQGNFEFFYNCFKKTLIVEANCLSLAGNNVDIVITDSTKDCESDISNKINKIFISTADVVDMLGGIFDPNIFLYTNNSYKYENIVNILSKKLKNKYDVIFSWETPIPFLEKMFPDALCVHQMPGVFSRPPYPYFITFDIYGLYKNGTIFNFNKNILDFHSNTNVVNDFFVEANKIFQNQNIFEEKINIYRKRFSKLSLLPLQVSAHYAFQADSKYRTQVEFLLDVVRQIPKDEGLIVTQYVNNNVCDMVINDKLLNFINKNNNIIWDPVFDKIDCVSQYILPFIDKIYSVSSSLFFQSFLWNKETSIVCNSFMKPYDSANISTAKNSASLLQRNTIDFFLSKHQILASRLFNDKFILALLEETIYRKRIGNKGIDTYPNLASLDKTYNENIISEFRESRSEKNIKKFFFNIVESNKQLEKLNNTIKDDSIQVISFDIFDTLVSRVLEKPVDVFRFLSEACFRESNGTVDNFFLLRTQAEVESRKNNPSQETTLDDIYTYIEKNFFLSNSLLNKMKGLELEYELMFSTPHPFGKKIFNIALEKRKRIILISDMYLPKFFIEKLLKKNGYNGYEKLYLSCELNLSKKKGDIYPFVIRDLNISPTSILHFGDNKESDINNANEHGLRTHYICNAITRMRANKFYKEIFPPRLPSNKARAACVGLIALKTFSHYKPILEKDSLFLRSPYIMGYNALGMIIVPYVLWLAQKAKEVGVSKIYFLSREGWLFKKVYDIISTYISKAPSSEYLYASRRALNIAMIEKAEDIITSSTLPFASGSTVFELIKSRFGINISEEDTEYCNNKLEYNINDRLLFIKICQSLSDKILDRAKKEREGYLSYLSTKGCFDIEHMAIADIGWKARMQSKLSKILSKPVTGFYYGTISESEFSIGLGNNIYTYISPCADAMNTSFIINNRHLCESLICCAEKSLEYISVENKKYIKHFINEANYYQRKIFIQDLHSGCIEFAVDFTKFFHSFFDSLFISQDMSCQILKHFVNNPSKYDLQLLDDVLFDDKIGGVSQKNIANFIKNTDITAKKDKAKDITAKKDQTKNNTIFYNIEKIIAPLIISNERKKNKYIRDRDEFFRDSKSKIARFWYTLSKK